MNWLLLVIIFNAPGGIATMQQEFRTQRACNDARIILSLNEPTVRAYCFPL